MARALVIAPPWTGDAVMSALRGATPALRGQGRLMVAALRGVAPRCRTTPGHQQFIDLPAGHPLPGDFTRHWRAAARIGRCTFLQTDRRQKAITYFVAPWGAECRPAACLPAPRHNEQAHGHRPSQGLPVHIADASGRPQFGTFDPTGPIRPPPLNARPKVRWTKGVPQADIAPRLERRRRRCPGLPTEPQALRGQQAGPG